MHAHCRSRSTTCVSSERLGTMVVTSAPLVNVGREGESHVLKFSLSAVHNGLQSSLLSATLWNCTAIASFTEFQHVKCEPTRLSLTILQTSSLVKGASVSIRVFSHCLGRHLLCKRPRTATAMASLDGTKLATLSCRVRVSLWQPGCKLSYRVLWSKVKAHIKEIAIHC